MVKGKFGKISKSLKIWKWLKQQNKNKAINLFTFPKILIDEFGNQSKTWKNTYKYCLRLLREFWDWIILEMFLLNFLGLLILLEIFLYFSASLEG